MKLGRTTLGAIAVHDFRRALRVLEKDIPRHELLKLLADRIRSKLVYVLAAYPVLLVGVFIITDCKDGNVILLPAFLGFAEIPLVYVVFMLAWLFAGFVVTYHNACLVSAFMRVLVKECLPFGSVAAFSAPYMGLSVVNFALETHIRYAKLAKTHKRMSPGPVVFRLQRIPIAAILGASWGANAIVFLTLVWSAVSVVRQSDPDRLLGVLSLCLIVGPVLNVIAYRIPFKLTR